MREFDQQANFLGFVQKIFVIQGRDKEGDFTINRTYSDFSLIREILVEKFSRIPIFPLPSENSSVFFF